ncbi:MAG: helix-turn-helix transcriptional regulator, partial [Oscillospiraceae bacterium]|nr:helix-turn-helix transcriptional regulator [Oscillospiraceae bacterium]
MDIGYALQNLLDNNNMTQKQLAIAIKISPNTLNGYIRNNHQPDYETLISIAKFFNVTVDYLLH